MQGSIIFKKISELPAEEKCEHECINAVRSAKAELAVVQRKISERTADGKAEHEFKKNCAHCHRRALLLVSPRLLRGGFVNACWYRQCCSADYRTTYLEICACSARP